MTLFHIFLVAAIQGITEFLPISSSGHLILLPALTGMPDQGLVMDVAVHVGTLFAVILYFWSDVRLAIIGLPRMLIGRVDTPGARLALLLLVATIPVIILGLLLKLSGLQDGLRSLTVIGWTTIIFGLLLYGSDQIGQRGKTTGDWSIRDAVKLGFWQAVALIPGTSRSGIVITGARFLGYKRHDAARHLHADVHPDHRRERHPAGGRGGAAGRYGALARRCHRSRVRIRRGASGAGLHDAASQPGEFHTLCRLPPRAGHGASGHRLWLTALRTAGSGPTP